MGRFAIIAVITLLFSLSIVGYNMNRRATSAVNNYTNYYSETRAEDVASSAAEIFIRKLNEDPTMRGTYTIDPLLQGSATVRIDSITGVYDTLAGQALDTLMMTSVGVFDGDSDVIMNKLYPVPLQIPTPPGAVSMSAGKSVSIEIGGHATTSGIDTNVINGSPAPDSVAGVAINSATPSSNISVDDNVFGKGGMVPDTMRVSGTANYTTFANAMIRLATVYSGETFSSGTLGTDLAPQITYFTGDTHITGPVTGSGILIVDGALNISGQFTFHGLVIVYGTTTISASSTSSYTQEGASAIYGGVVVAGENASYSQQGSALVRYSSAAIQNVQDKTVGKYLIMDWWQ